MTGADCILRSVTYSDSGFLTIGFHPILATSVASILHHESAIVFDGHIVVFTVFLYILFPPTLARAELVLY